jgi:type IV pilus assembly protein PilM
MFFGGPSNQTLGLDIGTHSVKAVLMENHRNSHRVLKAGVQPIHYDGEYDPTQFRKAETIVAVKSLMSDLKISPSKVKHLVSSIGGVATSMKEISAIQMAEEELATSLVFEARKHLPLDDSDTVIDHQVLGEDPTDPQKVRILLVATTRKMYAFHEDVLKESGFRPGVVDIDPLAVLNSFSFLSEMPDEGQLLFLNLGTRHTNFIVTGRKTKLFNRDVPIGGHHFTAGIAKQKGISYREAELLKTTEGVAAFDGSGSENGGLSLSLQSRTVLEDFVDDIRRTLRYYVKESGQSNFVKIYLTGGGAAFRGLPELLAEKFNVEVAVWNPASQMDSRAELGRWGAQMTQCLGLALRRE